jgi:hypothetical protein
MQILRRWTETPAAEWHNWIASILAVSPTTVAHLWTSDDSLRKNLFLTIATLSEIPLVSHRTWTWN